MALERLPDRADRRRQHAAEVGVALGEAEAVAAGRRRGPDRQPLALGEGDAEVPGAAGVDVGAGDEDRVGGRLEGGGEGADRLRVGAARPLTLRSIAARASPSSTSAYQSSIGSETKTGPRGGRPARWAPWASASGTSSARGGS